jgi:calcineurin-like phosphoesterase
MCGTDNSVLGIDSKCIIEKLRMHTPVKFTVSGKKVTAHGAVFTLDGATGKVKKVERIKF